MSHAVFISYASEDEPVARNICRILEARGVRCWLAARDIPFGADWTRKTKEAIDASRLLVLVLSAHTGRSDYVKNELLISRQKLAAVPFCVGKVDETELELTLAGTQRLRAANPPTKDDFNKLADSVQSLLGGREDPPPPPPPPRRRWPVVLAAMVVFSLFAAGVLLYLGRGARQPPQPAPTPPAPDEYRKNYDALVAAMPWLNWVVYDPSGYDPFEDRPLSEEVMRQDLRVLRRHGFNGLITLTAQKEYAAAARVAREEGFAMVIVGVWEVDDEEEAAAALGAAPYAAAYCLGHRGLNSRYSVGYLEMQMKRFREQTRLPVTTSELVVEYETNPRLAEASDFLFPDVHASWHGGQTPRAAWDETLALMRRAAQTVAAQPGKPVLLKMVSFPSGGAAGLTPEAQREFYRLAVEERVNRNDIPARVAFSFLGAFDTDWKTAERGFKEPERHTGLFTKSREPKPAVTDLRWGAKR